MQSSSHPECSTVSNRGTSDVLVGIRRRRTLVCAGITGWMAFFAALTVCCLAASRCAVSLVLAGQTPVKTCRVPAEAVQGNSPFTHAKTFEFSLSRLIVGGNNERVNCHGRLSEVSRATMNYDHPHLPGNLTASVITKHAFTLKREGKLHGYAETQFA